MFFAFYKYEQLSNVDRFLDKRRCFKCEKYNLISGTPQMLFLSQNSPFYLHYNLVQKLTRDWGDY